MAQKQLTAKVRLVTTDAEKALSNLAKKIQGIESKINKLANNSKLETQFNKQAVAAEKVKQEVAKTNIQQEKLKQATQKTTQEVNKTAVSQERVKQATMRTQALQSKIASAYTKTQTKLGSIKSRVMEWASGQRMVHSSTLSTNSVLGSVWSKLKGIAATYLGIMGMKGMVNATDTITSAENKINYLSANQLGDAGKNADGTYSTKTLSATQDAMDKMYASSQKVRMGYGDMMTNVSKMMTLAPDSFQGNIDNAIRFQEIMAESYALGGASAEEMSTSMYQLTQALGAGTLAGDELRSVREGAPLAYKAIEEFVQGVWNTDESLKDLGSQGKVTSDMVVAAIMTMGKEADTAFAQTQQTFAQTWDQIKNAALYAFDPVGDKLREALTKALDNGMIAKFEIFFTAIAQLLLKVFQFISIGIQWIAENWDWLQHIIVAALLIICGYMILMGTISLITAIQSIIGFATMYWWAIILLAGILALVYIFYLWKVGAIDTVNAIYDALVILAATIVILGAIIAGVVGAVTAGIVLMIIGAVLILVAAIINYLDYVMGAIYGAGAFLYNLFFGYIDGMIQVIWSYFVDPIKGIIEWFVNAWNDSFTSVGGAFANFCGQLLSGLIGLVKPFAKLLDKLFGWDTNGAIESAQSAMKSWGKAEGAITYSVEAPTTSGIAKKLGLDIPDRISYQSAWDSGVSQGAEWKNSLNNLGSKFQMDENAFSLNSIKKKLGLPTSDTSDKLKTSNISDPARMITLDGDVELPLKKNKKISDSLPNGSGGSLSGFPTASDPAYSVADSYKMPSNEDLLAGINDIADNTSSMADSMELSEEDLRYLRDVANMEWKKEFTTAEIHVEMNNNNTVNGDSDLDGLVTRLTDKLYEELDAVANGVYA